MPFSSSKFPQHFFFFWWSPIFFSSPLKLRGSCISPNTIGITSNYHFSVIFSIILLWDSHSIWVLGMIYCNTATKTPSIFKKRSMKEDDRFSFWCTLIFLEVILSYYPSFVPACIFLEVYQMWYSFDCLYKKQYWATPIHTYWRHILSGNRWRRS